MRIISSFSDYYDGLQDHEDTHVWLREPSIIFHAYNNATANLASWEDRVIDNLTMQSVTDRSNKDKVVDYFPFLFGFAGKIIKLYGVYEEIKLDEEIKPLYKNCKITNGEVFKSVHSCEEILEIREKNENSRYSRKKSYRWWRKDPTMFEDIDYTWLENMDLFTNYNTPLFILKFNTPRRLKGYNRRDLELITNFGLKDFSLHSLYDITQVYQKLDMFVSGVLTNIEKIIPLEEKYRQGNRFDKYSFRTPPSKKR